MELSEQDIEQIQIQVQEFTVKFNQKPMIQEARQRWQDYTPTWARYHRPEHTDDVLQEALLFAIADGITDERSLELIGIMAIFHDIGMTMEPDDPDNLRKNHEERGAKLAVEAMQRFGDYSDEEIKIVKESIEDTEITMRVDKVLVQQLARHRLGMYLLDGDLSNLGRPDFSEKSELEFEEQQYVFKNPPDGPKFNKNTLGLIKNHTFQSPAAIKYRQEQQGKNVAELEKVA